MESRIRVNRIKCTKIESSYTSKVNTEVDLKELVEAAYYEKNGFSYNENNLQFVIIL